MFNSFYNNSDFYVELTDYLTTIKNKEESVIKKQSCCNKTNHETNKRYIFI